MVEEWSLDELKDRLKGRKIVAYDADLAISYYGVFKDENLDQLSWRLVIWGDKKEKIGNTMEIRILVANIKGDKVEIKTARLEKDILLKVGEERPITVGEFLEGSN